jgi:hypothetical protein
MPDLPGVPDWVPMLWPSEWLTPSIFGLIRKTPVNCVLVEWEARARLAGAGILQEVRKQDLALVGLVREGADGGEAAAAARAGELSAVASGKFTPADGVKVICWTKSSGFPRRSGHVALAFTDCAWPGTKLSASARGGNEAVVAGPTGVPWVDTNGWFIRMVRTLVPDKPVWVLADPPKTSASLHPEAYMLAVSDAAASGGRWVVSLGQELPRALAAGNAEALAAWDRIAGAITFYEQRKDRRSWVAAGLLGVLSDFAGDNEGLSTELLNLVARRHLGFRVLDKTNPAQLSFEGLRAVVFADREPPGRDLGAKLEAFAKAGGLVIFPIRSAGLPGGVSISDQIYHGFDVRQFGTGRLAVAKQDVDDPYSLTIAAHSMLSRRYDLLRTGNGSAAIACLAASRDRKRSAVSIVNYSTRPFDDMSLSVAGDFRSARLWTSESKTAVPLKPTRDRGRVEFHLPSIGVFAEIELEA